MAESHSGEAEESSALQGCVMARLSLSAVGRLVGDPEGWREPAVHRALLVSGLTLLLAQLAAMRAQQPH